VKSSTATGTTATAEPLARVQAGPSGDTPAVSSARIYRGRFAPSPTGALHQGSLFAALASWLDARAHGGTWIVRMEDVDTPRLVPGAASSILATLARYRMVSDEPVLHQSTRAEAYRQALDLLRDKGLVYRCRCSRSEIKGPYPGHCRDLGLTDPDTSWRLRLEPDAVIAFDDALQGHCEYRTSDLGDPVLVRRDGVAAYQLAVVIDDAFQGITDVVRGADLLESTAWQVALFQALDLPVPRYVHVPLLTEPDGQKLAKSRSSAALDHAEPTAMLVETLALLGLRLPSDIKAADGSDILHCAVQHWDPGRLNGTRTVKLPR
jgi:glutamyl-Q tRNA(Asp) synthetase